MKTLILMAAVALVALVVAALLVKAQRKGRGAGDQPRMRAVMTPRELEAFAVLKAALEPQHAVLAQVAFSALLTAKAVATRNTFDRKVSDFAVLRSDGSVAVLIEIDDASHKGREARDRRRDDLLTEAGYSVIRYGKVPTAERVREDVAQRVAAATVQAAPSLAPAMRSR